MSLSNTMTPELLKQILKSKIPKEFKKGMKIKPSNREKMILESGETFIQQAYGILLKQEGVSVECDEFIGFLCNLILSWPSEDVISMIKKLTFEWFAHLNKIDYKEDNLEKNRLSMILLVGTVLLERMKE